MSGGGWFPRWGKKKQGPKEYRRYINLYKQIKEDGWGAFVPWRPRNFREFIRDWKYVQISNWLLVLFLALAALVAFLCDK